MNDSAILLLKVLRSFACNSRGFFTPLVFMINLVEFIYDIADSNLCGWLDIGDQVCQAISPWFQVIDSVYLIVENINFGVHDVTGLLSFSLFHLHSVDLLQWIWYFFINRLCKLRDYISQLVFKVEQVLSCVISVTWLQKRKRIYFSILISLIFPKVCSLLNIASSWLLRLSKSFVSRALYFLIRWGCKRARWLYRYL